MNDDTPPPPGMDVTHLTDRAGNVWTREPGGRLVYFLGDPDPTVEPDGWKCGATTYFSWPSLWRSYGPITMHRNAPPTQETE